jgi:hypothetical protein
MLANFVDGDATLSGGMLATAQSRVDLFAKDLFQTFRQGLAQFQTEGHVFLREGEPHVAVAFFARHFPPKPPWRFESPATGGIRKFHLGNDKTLMAAAINIDLNQETFPWEFVTYLS